MCRQFSTKVHNQHLSKHKCNKIFTVSNILILTTIYTDMQEMPLSATVVIGK